MFIKSISLRNYRNISSSHIEFRPGFNLFIGRNAQGKTNVLEAISLMSFGRSFRTNDTVDLLKQGELFSEIKAIAQFDSVDDELLIRIDNDGKNFFRNKKKTTSGGFKGVCAVLFAPEEILLLRDSPDARRSYVDRLIGQLEDGYRTTSRNYTKVISQRNRILKDDQLSFQDKVRQLSVWNEQLSQLGAKIITRRAAWMVRLNRYIPDKYANMAGEDGPAGFIYRPQCGNELSVEGESVIKDGLLRLLDLRSRDEFERRISLVGPQRDDFEAVIGAGAVKRIGSQGQHRSFVLAIKMAEMELIKEVINEEPILLLDDVGSELDSERKKKFFQYLNRAHGQVFITATSEDDVSLSDSIERSIFYLSSGTVSPRK